jgi:CheY-like chemotaxis protein
MKHRVRLIHWNAAEAQVAARTLRALGFEVDARPVDAAALRAMKADPPLAFVSDLTRLPSQGRDFAVWLRQAKRTRNVPIVFVGGDRQKISRVRRVLPDAIFTTWKRIQRSLGRAIVRPPPVETVPRSVFAAYSDAPLGKKLGLRARSSVVLVNAPLGFRRTLESLPLELDVHAIRGRTRLSLSRQSTASRPSGITLWFVRSARDLRWQVKCMRSSAETGGLWIVWPKQTSELASDLTQARVRELALAAGLVDYKVCAIDATWSGLKLTRRAATQRISSRRRK